MSIRFRVTLALILAGLVPLVAMLYLANQTVVDVRNLVVVDSRTALEQARQGAVLDTVDQTTQSAQYRLLLITVALGVGAFALSGLIGPALINPVRKMTKETDQVSGGNWEAFEPSDDPSEFGALSRSIYRLTVQLMDGLQNLEKQVSDRTQELSRRNDQLEGASVIAREVATIRNIDQLLNRVTHLIHDRFGFYHVGIFLIDEARDFAILRAANTEGGQHLIASGYKLKVGEDGIVGHVSQMGKPRVAFDVDKDNVFITNPELPSTRSEVALPLKIRERVIGVLDVHSTEATAFSLQDMNLGQILADQIALAVENARLYTESQQALQELDKLHGQQTLQGWSQRLREHPSGFVYNRLGVQAADPSTLTPVQVGSEAVLQTGQNAYQLTVPIRLRGQVIGAIVLQRETDQRPWTEEEAALVTETLTQIAPALENARLLEEAQARALQEQAVNVISTQIRGSVNLDSILQNTVRELGRVLNSSRTFIQLGLEQSADKYHKQDVVEAAGE